MATNLFDYFEESPVRDGGRSRWAARSPRRPARGYDLKLVPRAPRWREDREALDALERLAASRGWSG